MHMDSYAVMRGVSALSDYLSKDRHYLNKMVDRSDDYGAGYQKMIDSRIAHHNQLVDTLNGLFASVGKELGSFEPEKRLFERYVDPRETLVPDVLVTPVAYAVPVPDVLPEPEPEPEAPPEPEPDDVPDWLVTPESDDVTVVVSDEPDELDHVDEVDTDDAPDEPEISTTGEVFPDEDLLGEPDVPESAPVVEVTPETKLRHDFPETAAQYIGKTESSQMAHEALSEHEAATAASDVRVNEPTAIDVLNDEPVVLDDNDPTQIAVVTTNAERGREEGVDALSMDFPMIGNDDSDVYTSPIEDDIRRINDESYGHPTPHLAVDEEPEDEQGADAPFAEDADDEDGHPDDQDDSNEEEDGYPDDYPDDVPPDFPEDSRENW